jgi:protein ImuB
MPLPSRIACLRLLDETPSAASRIDALHDLAAAFSPRVERCRASAPGEQAVCLEVGDLRRLYPSEHALVDAIRGMAGELELAVGVVIASNKAVAQVRARGLCPLAPSAIVPAGWERSAIAALPLSCLAPSSDQLARLRQWGLSQVGDLARLPRKAVATRLGQSGLSLHQLACGECLAPLYPSPPSAEVIEEQGLLDPVAELEPLLFVLRGLIDRVVTRLRARSSACGGLQLRLQRADSGAARGTFAGDERRAIAIAAPTQKVPALLDLVRVSLESQPLLAAVERIEIRAQPVDPRPVQLDLFAPAGPAPERLAATLARLQALCGASRIGQPQAPDSYAPGAAATIAFVEPSLRRDRVEPASPAPGPAPGPLSSPDLSAASASLSLFLATRVLRPAQPAQVICQAAAPTRLAGGLYAGEVRRSGGPYRLCDEGQTRDYFDVELESGSLLRLRHDLDRGDWFVDAVYD